MFRVILCLFILGLTTASWAGQDSRTGVTLNAVTAHAQSEKVAAKVEVTGSVETTVDELKGAWVGYFAKTFSDLRLPFKSESHMEVYALENFCSGAQVGKMERQLNMPAPAGAYYPISKISVGVAASISTITVYYRDVQNRPWTQSLSCKR